MKWLVRSSRDTIYWCNCAVVAIAVMGLGGCGRSTGATHADPPSGSSTALIRGDLELTARRLFAKEKACPLERVTATVQPPPSRADSRAPDGAPLPELKIMADITFMAAAGCGLTVIYACLARPGEVAYCVAPGPAPPAFGAGATPTDPP